VPIYEFVCEACGRLMEVMQKVGDPAPPACPECGGTRMARMVSRTSFQLKGGGWYSDLYSSPKEKPKVGGEPMPAAPAGAGSGGAASSGGAPPSPSTPSTTKAPPSGSPTGGSGGSSTGGST